MNQRSKAYLVLADGTRFEGESIGAAGVALGEVVFTTGMTGYQEVLTDPSYCGQIVTMTAPHIGNTGVNSEDQESKAPCLSGFIVHQAASHPSNWRAEASLQEYLQKHGIVALSGIDTRALTQHIRDTGAQMAALGSEDPQTLHDRAKAAPPMSGQDLTQRVSTKAPYAWSEGSGVWGSLLAAKDEAPFRVVALDFGVKLNILRCLVDVGCDVTVLPSTSTASAVMAQRPDGIFLSNGPGDPAAVKQGIQTVNELLGQRPIFGICLGHQILSHALGAKSYKLKFGHRGLNQPVKDLQSGRVEITTQNHGFVIDVDSLKERCDLTHIHLNDGTCEGIVHRETGAFSVQYHPEAAAGPHDARYLFERFVQNMRSKR